ncbi:hypothetical protein [Microvirga massiliensis]|uniref:hypothetical protein n=1 Tax=Microvirga massiliensis TaxID=1033741 RepID=UPI00062BCDCC|nr:hypothetical protein [Microvirga massiliensis]
MRRAVFLVIACGFAGPVWAQDTPAGMTPIISAKYGERVCGYKVNLQKLTDHIQRVSGIPAVSVFQDPELTTIMDHMWKRYDEMGKHKACPTILREYGPRGTLARGVLSR